MGLTSASTLLESSTALSSTLASDVASVVGGFSSVWVDGSFGLSAVSFSLSGAGAVSSFSSGGSFVSSVLPGSSTFCCFAGGSFVFFKEKGNS